MEPNQSQYDFITNTAAPKKNFGPVSQKTRIIQVVVGLFILIILAIVIFSFVGSLNAGPKQELLELGAAQADLISVSTLGAQESKSTNTQSNSRMILLTTASQKNETTAIMQSYGITKNAEKQIAIYQDGSYTEKLETAAQTNTFESTYQTILADKLGAYRAKLQNIYSKIENTEQKKLFSDFYLQLETLAPTAKQ